MIKYISSFSVKTLHSMVNTALLQMLVALRPAEEIVVEATASSIESLRQATETADSGLRFKKLYVNSRSGRVGLLLRYLQSAWYNVVSLLRSKKGDTLIYNFNNLYSVKALNFLSLKVCKGRKIIVFCHSEMEYLSNGHKHNKAYKRLMVRLTNGFFRDISPSKISKDIHYVVLGDVILRNLKKYIGKEMWSRFRSIDHPVRPIKSLMEFSCGEDRVPRLSDRRLRLGTVGIMNEYKGSRAYLEMLERFRGDDRFEFSIVGQVQDHLEDFRRLGVRLATRPEQALPDEEFREMVSQLDYILLFYPSDNYNLFVSGALLDTVRFHKPLVGIETAYFRYFFDKFGDVGILAKDEAEMERIIRSLPDREPPQYDFETAMVRLSTEALTPRFAEILSDKG
ncbi:MAG: hypothetical protein NC328_04800 [Muribaculum sp.]|nr:hypothetical protein [Muribaculum sp.]